MAKNTNSKKTNPVENIFSKFNTEQLELTGMSIQSLLQVGGQTLLKQAIAAEIEQFLGRRYYEHFKPNVKKTGYRNGYRKTTIDTPCGPITYDRPTVADSTGFESQFHKSYMKRSPEFAASICDMYVNGISTRKVKKSLESVAGDKIKLSKSTVSRVTEKLKEDFKVWKNRDLSNLDVTYLFIDAIRVGMRIGEYGKDSVLVAYGLLSNGQFEPIAIGLGNSESKPVWGNFISNLKQRGLKDPLICISDGNQGAIQALDSNFPTSYRQRCVKHKMENIMDAIPKDKHVEIRKKLNLIFYGSTSLEQAKTVIRNFKKEYSKIYPSAVTILETDLDQCLSFYLFPVKHWKRIRTSNKLERMNVELRRRLNVIGRHPSEEGCLALIYQVSKNYSFGQQNVHVSDLDKILFTKLKEHKQQMLQQLELDIYAA